MIYDIKVDSIGSRENENYISFCERTPDYKPQVLVSQYKKQETQRNMTKELWIEGRYNYTHLTGLSDKDLYNLSQSINNYLKHKLQPNDKHIGTLQL